MVLSDVSEEESSFSINSFVKFIASLCRGCTSDDDSCPVCLSFFASSIPQRAIQKSTRLNSSAKVVEFHESAFAKADNYFTKLDKLSILVLSAGGSVVRRRHSEVTAEGSCERTMVLKSAAVAYLDNRYIHVPEKHDTSLLQLDMH